MIRIVGWIAFGAMLALAALMLATAYTNAALSVPVDDQHVAFAQIRVEFQMLFMLQFFINAIIILALLKMRAGPIIHD